MCMDMSAPLVSIVIPCFNVENYIEDCLKSILKQTYLNKEVLMIDDGSTDNTLDKIQQFIDVYSGAGGYIEFLGRRTKVLPRQEILV